MAEKKSRPCLRHRCIRRDRPADGLAGAGAAESLEVMLIGVRILVPAIAGYAEFLSWVFRGTTGDLKDA